MGIYTAGSGDKKSTSLSGWDSGENYVERVMDNAAYTSAHPDDTLVLIGPPRFTSDGPLVAVGMLQAFQVSQQRQVTPMQTIGSNRSFFLAGKSAVQFQIGRLFVRGNNLLRALYSNVKNAGVDLKTFGTSPVEDGAYDAQPIFKNSEGIAAGVAGDSGYVANLDSEMFLVPFGMKCEFRDKQGSALGAFYLELCVINSFTVGVNAGQNMILENVSGMADRLVPAGGAETPDDGLVKVDTSDKIWNPA